MPRYTPRQSSNTPLIAAAAVFGLLAISGVGGFLLYRATSASRPTDETVAESKQRDVRAPIPTGTSAIQLGKSAPRTDTVRAAPTRKADPARAKAADDQKWRADVMKDIDAARLVETVKEPVQARGMTAVEYKRALVLVPRFKAQYPVEGPIPSYRLLLNADQSGAAAVMPETSRVLRREAFTQIARYDRPGMERLVMQLSGNHPDLRQLLDNDLYAKLHATLPWDERKAHYARFQMLTGVKGEWSLLHPFDDLTGPQMTTAIGAAEKLKSNGLRALTPDERLALLAAGAVDAVEEAMTATK